MGSEVDFVVEVAGLLIPIEIKLSATPRPSMARSIKSFLRDMGGTVAPGYVVDPGYMQLSLGSDVTSLPFASLWQGTGIWLKSRMFMRINRSITRLPR